MEGILKAGYKSVFPASTLRGVDPSQVGSKVFWFKPNSLYVDLNGNFISQWDDAFGLGHDILQATVGAQPLYLPFTGPVSGGNGNYMYYPGNNNGEYVSTPDSAALSITGDIDIRCLCEPNDWQTGLKNFVSKYSTSAGQRSFMFYISLGVLTFIWSENGSTLRTASSTVVVPFTGQSLGAVRAYLDVDNGTGVYEVTFYTSPDGSGWTQLGSSVLGTVVTSIFDSTTKVEVGSRGNGTFDCFNGKIYNLNIRDSFSGSPVAAFNPDKGNAYSSTFVARTGETWTLTNLTSTLNFHVQLVDQAMVVFDGTNDFLKSAPFTFNQPATVYLMVKQNSYTATDYLIDGNNTNLMGLTQGATTPRIRQNAGVNGTENAGFALNTFRIITLIYNGATSLCKIDSTGTSVTSNAGTNNPGGINLGSRGDNSRWGNITVLEYLGYNSVHSSALQLSIITDMARRHKYTLT